MRGLAKASIVVGALLILATACSKSSSPANGGSSGGTAPTLTINGEKATDKGTKDVTGMSSFTLNLDNDPGVYYFEPTVLKGAPGQKVTLTLKNVGNVHHNFTLASESLNQDVNTPGASATVSITFPQSGTAEFHCEYHHSLGMVGELSVS